MKKNIISLIISFTVAMYANAEMVRLGAFGLSTPVQTAGETSSSFGFMTAKAITNLVEEADEKYMCFTIPLNPAGSDVYTLTGHKWTDFEIKISYVTNSTQPFNMVYYWQSQGNPFDGNNAEFGDTNARCYFIDDHKKGDIRQWSIYTNETVDVMSLLTQCESTNSLIDTVILYPSQDGCKLDWTTWQWYTNACNLRASWIRYDELGPELNAAGAQRWQPIEIRWVNKRQTED